MALPNRESGLDPAKEQKTSRKSAQNGLKKIIFEVFSMQFHHNRRARLAVRYTILLAGICCVQAQTTPRQVAIRCGRLIDGKSATARPNAVIVIEGERIVSVGDAVPA